MNEKILLSDGHHGNQAVVTENGELCVCLCEKACKGTVTLKDLMGFFPDLKIAVRRDQITDVEKGYDSEIRRLEKLVDKAADYLKESVRRSMTLERTAKFEVFIKELSTEKK